MHLQSADFDLRCRWLIKKKEFIVCIAGAVVLSVQVKVAHLAIWWSVGASSKQQFHAMKLISIFFETLIVASNSFIIFYFDSLFPSRVSLLSVGVVGSGIFQVATIFCSSTAKSLAESVCPAVVEDSAGAELEDGLSCKEAGAVCERVLEVVCSG